MHNQAKYFKQRLTLEQNSSWWEILQGLVILPILAKVLFLKVLAWLKQKRKKKRDFSIQKFGKQNKTLFLHLYLYIIATVRLGPA